MEKNNLITFIIFGCGVLLVAVFTIHNVNATGQFVVFISPVSELTWDSNQQNNYINDDMNIISQYPEEAGHPQILNGTYDSIMIKPIINTLDQTIIIRLFHDGSPTNYSFRINPGNYTTKIINVNFTFNQGDNLVWVINGRSNTANSLKFDTQVIIDYTK